MPSVKSTCGRNGNRPTSVDHIDRMEFQGSVGLHSGSCPPERMQNASVHFSSVIFTEGACGLPCEEWALSDVENLHKRREERIADETDAAGCRHCRLYVNRT